MFLANSYDVSPFHSAQERKTRKCSCFVNLEMVFSLWNLCVQERHGKSEQEGAPQDRLPSAVAGHRSGKYIWRDPCCFCCRLNWLHPCVPSAWMAKHLGTCQQCEHFGSVGDPDKHGSASFWEARSGSAAKSKFRSCGGSKSNQWSHRRSQ